MKRFLGLAAVIGLLAGVGTQTWAAACKLDGQDLACDWGTSCWNIDDQWSSVDKADVANGIVACDAGTCTCENLIKNCETFGTMFTGNTATPGAGVKCNGTVVGGTNPNDVLGYCRWNGLASDCGPVTTEKGKTDCGTADWYSSMEACREGDTPGGGGGTAGGPCKIDGKFAFCGYAAYGDDPDGCFKLSNQYPPDTGKTCEELISACKNNYGKIYTGSSSPAVLDEPPYGAGETCAGLGLTEATTSVKLAGSKAATPGLKVSYAKNRVTVNWTPTAKVSSGTIQLLNAKGVALSTSYIKANSGKVTAKLATVGVPAGMYFVHISAVGVNGQKIVTQSAVSIVK